MNLEKYLVLIKPEAIPNANDVLRKLHYAGFHRIQRKAFILSADEILEFNTLTGKADEKPSQTPDKGGPYMAICVCKENAIDELQRLFADNDAVHVSQCSDDAYQEIKYFFPNSIIQRIDHSNLNERLEYHMHDTLSPTLPKCLLEVVDRCPGAEIAIYELRSALALRNPITPVIIEPDVSANVSDTVLEK